MQILLLWNDSAANRIVKFAVDYSIDAEMLNVFDVRPIEVSLLDLQWDTVVTCMRVRSSKTYDLFRERFLESGCLNDLVDQIADRHQLSVITH